MVWPASGHRRKIAAAVGLGVVLWKLRHRGIQPLAVFLLLPSAALWAGYTLFSEDMGVRYIIPVVTSPTDYSDVLSGAEPGLYAVSSQILARGAQSGRGRLADPDPASRGSGAYVLYLRGAVVLPASA